MKLSKIHLVSRNLTASSLMKNDNYQHKPPCSEQTHYKHKVTFAFRNTTNLTNFSAPGLIRNPGCRQYFNLNYKTGAESQRAAHSAPPRLQNTDLQILIGNQAHVMHFVLSKKHCHCG